MFNLEEDIEEQHDLTAKRPEVVRRVREKFAAWQSAMQAADPFRDY